MMFRRKAESTGEPVRIFFCTDLHGSDICFRKFLHAGSTYEAQTVIMGGDCTGKMVVPLVKDGDAYEVEWAGKFQSVATGLDLEDIESQIANTGLYPIHLSQSEMVELQGDAGRLHDVFREAMCERLRAWIDLATDRLRDSEIEVIFTPGNDDEFEIDEILRASEFISTPEGTVTRIADGRHEMLSLGWSNPTPWDTPRECSEEELYEKISTLADQVEDMSRAIFNIHVPPYGTGLDTAAEIEDGSRLKRGGTIQGPVGSKAVRDAILEYQPLLALHGHIHESRGAQKLGSTLAINPGSAYSDWSLQGVIVDLEGDQVSRNVPVVG